MNRKIVLGVFTVIIVCILLSFYFFKNKEKSQEVQSDNTEENVSSIENTSWKITQYGISNGGQMTGYTIEGNNYGLIIVDGGYYNDDSDQALYKEVIKNHNNVVDAWILTHYDIDHAGAFLSLYDTMPELVVNKLYTQGMPDEEVAKSKAPWEEDWSLYERYMNEEIPFREVTKPGFEVQDIIGLRYKVLSVYEPWMDEELSSLLNSGSMIFKLYGKEQSIMYCADVTTNVIEEKIMNNYKEDIPSDFIQIAHHGNSVFSEDFYKLVNPKVAFFDAPMWLFDNVNNVSWYTIQKTASMFNEWGVKIYNFSSSPNSVEMK